MSTIAPPRQSARIQTLVERASGASEWAVLRWLVPLAILQGLIYMFVVPPWQHYDEPAHFSYVAGIVAGEPDAVGPKGVALSREIADSMYRHNFWPDGQRPDMLSNAGPSLGENQRVHPRLYYALVAAPVWVVRYLPIEQQLYTARAVSLVFYVLTIVAAWRIAVAVLPDEPLMQLIIPLILLLTPAFADLMTAVNSDVPVNFAATASLLGAVLLLRDGPRPVALALALLGLAAALLAKRSALPLVVPVAIALIWAVRRRPLPWWVLPTSALAVVTILALAVFRPVSADDPENPHIILAVQPWVSGLFTSYLRIDADAWVRSVSDTSLFDARHLALLEIGFVSFWTRFGWGNVLAGQLWDWAFAALAILACVGLIAGAARRDSSLDLWQRRVIWLFFIAVVCAWVVLFARLHPLPPLGQWIYYPRGRYMFWAMVPHLWLLLLGLLLLVPARWRRFGPLTVLAFFALYTVAAYSILLSHYAA